MLLIQTEQEAEGKNAAAVFNPDYCTSVAQLLKEESTATSGAREPGEVSAGCSRA